MHKVDRKARQSYGFGEGRLPVCPRIPLIICEPGNVTKSFVDDPAGNAAIGIALAETRCTACGDFHLASLARRAALPPDRRVGDEAEFSEAVRRCLARHASGNGDAPHVVIAGTTDTWLYTLLLNAAADAGGEAFARALSVEIVDQCETPLELCRRFAAVHDLVLHTACGDIADFMPARPADLVLMHGVLPFFPPDRQQSCLRHVGTWLSGSGTVLCSNQHGEQRGGAELEGRIAFTLKSLERLLAGQSGQDPGRHARLQARIDQAFRLRQGHARSFSGEAEARRFFGEAGLELVAYRAFANRPASGQPARYRERVILECIPKAGTSP